MTSPPRRQTFLTLTLITLLLSGALARSLRDENMQNVLRGIMAEDEAEPSEFDTLLHRLLIPVDEYTPRSSAAESVHLKRSWADDDKRVFNVPEPMKRKMFWTPLGHLPASARMGRPQAGLRPHMEVSGSSVFRYG
uniref:NKY n=1 Tax=Charonia tritonis TaxID=1960912 RepID=A0A1S6JQ42_9CAEN|nr:NKY precursor [Charonia tritonis]